MAVAALAAVSEAGLEFERSTTASEEDEQKEQEAGGISPPAANLPGATPAVAAAALEDESSTTASEEEEQKAESEKVPAQARDLKEETKKKESEKIRRSIRYYPDFFSSTAAATIEAWIDETSRCAGMGYFPSPHTVDVTKHRTKYFFGSGYTYGRQKNGVEEVLPEGSVDAVPDWIWMLVVRPMEALGVVPPGWINSVVMNDYRAPGGCIVSHVDPPHLFDRPIFSASFFDSARLVFGASFDPERRQAPVYCQHMHRGSLLGIAGYAANEVTHGIRPEDIFGKRRVSIVLRHIKDDAPRVGPPLLATQRAWLLSHVQGRWKNESGDIFYEVTGMEVRVLAKRISSEEGWPKDPFQLGTWTMDFMAHGLVCNTGVLDCKGLKRDVLFWRLLTGHGNREGRSKGFTWLRWK